MIIKSQTNRKLVKSEEI